MISDAIGVERMREELRQLTYTLSDEKVQLALDAVKLVNADRQIISPAPEHEHAGYRE